MSITPLFIDDAPFGNNDLKELSAAEELAWAKSALNAWSTGPQGPAVGVHVNNTGVFQGTGPVYFQDTELTSGTVKSHPSTFFPASNSGLSGAVEAPDEKIDTTYAPCTISRGGSLTSGLYVSNDELASGYNADNIFWPIGRDQSTGQIRSMTIRELYIQLYQPAMNYVMANTAIVKPGMYYIISQTAYNSGISTSYGTVATDTYADVTGWADSLMPGAGSKVDFANTTNENYLLVRGDTDNTTYNDGIFAYASPPSQSLRTPCLFWRTAAGKISIRKMAVQEWVDVIGGMIGYFMANGYNDTANGGTYTNSGRFGYASSKLGGLGGTYTAGNMGMGMQNTTLEGLDTAGEAGNYRQYQAGANDYRSVEIPFGSPTVRDTSYMVGGHRSW